MTKQPLAVLVREYVPFIFAAIVALAFGTARWPQKNHPLATQTRRL